MKKQPEITDATRQAFVSAFCRLSEENPNKNITIQQIADCAGYNRTTFYRYFPDVVAVKEYLEDTLIHTLKGRLKERGGSGMNDPFFSVFLDVFEKEKSTFRILLRDSNRSHFIHKIQNAILPTISKADCIGDTDPRIKTIMTIYFSGVFSALADWINSPESITEDDLLGIVSSLFETWFVPQIQTLGAKNTS